MCSPNNNSELIMIIAEERGTIRTLFDFEEDKSIPQHKINALEIRATLNPDLRYYKVNCDLHAKCGYTADELFDEIQEKYVISGKKPLDTLFSFIKRI